MRRWSLADAPRECDQIFSTWMLDDDLLFLERMYLSEVSSLASGSAPTYSRMHLLRASAGRNPIEAQCL